MEARKLIGLFVGMSVSSACSAYDFKGESELTPPPSKIMRFFRVWRLTMNRRSRMTKSLLLAAMVAYSITAYGDEADDEFIVDLVTAAKERTTHDVRYDGSYFSIPYPNGDVPSNIGVCTDVVIRAFRVVGIDLQKAVHEDMLANFSSYPSKRIWGLKRPDNNIDHRRVPNLRTFFKRHGQSLEVTNDPDNYRPGDLVTWVLPGNLPHIGIIIDLKSDDRRGIPLVAHNIGEGPKINNMLFDYPITGHYRYRGH